MVTTMARDLLMLSQALMLMLSTDTMAMEPISVMPTMDTMDTHMPTTVSTMARDLLMLSQRPMLMLSTDTTAMELISVMPTTDTTDTHMPVTDMPTTDTTDTHTLTDMESKMLTK